MTALVTGVRDCHVRATFALGGRLSGPSLGAYYLLSSSFAVILFTDLYHSTLPQKALGTMAHATLRCRAQLVQNGHLGPTKSLQINRRTALISSLGPAVAMTSGTRAADARGPASTAVVPLADLPMRR